MLAVRQAAGEAINRARRGGGPTLLECKTYRTRAHSEGMRDAGYRTQDEVERWKMRDPILLFRRRLTEDLGLPVSDLERIDDDAIALAEDAITFAQSSPWPDPDTAAANIYA